MFGHLPELVTPSVFLLFMLVIVAVLVAAVRLGNKPTQVDQLTKLAELRASGMISDEEFARARAKLVKKLL